MERQSPHCVRQEEVVVPSDLMHAMSSDVQANRWILSEILGIDEMRVQETPFSVSPYETAHTYICIKDRREVCRMTIPDDVPLQDKVTALKAALRLSHGNNTEGKEGRNPKIT